MQPEVEEIPDAEHELLVARVAAIDVAKAAGKVCVRLPGTVNLSPCRRSTNNISLIGNTRPGESRRRTWENRPRIAQVDSARPEIAKWKQRERC